MYILFPKQLKIYINLLTESLKKQLMEVHKALAEIAASSCKENGDDYVEARIRFLQHQVGCFILYICTSQSH